MKNDADYTNVNEDTVTKQYDEAGSYSVTLKTEYEDSNGDTKIHRTQTVIDVIDGPEPNIGATQYQFTVDDQEVNGEVIGSTVTGQMHAGTCSNYCGGAFSFDGIGLAISEGINMLVLEADRDGNQYNPVHYGTYDVNNDAFATTNTVTSDGMDSIRNSMSNGGTSGASQNLIDDINNLKGENRYFMFVSGGNPLPTQKSSEVFSTLESLGADLNGGNTKELEQNSMWTFTTQTLSNDDVTPLQESYVPDSSNLPAISHDYSLEPVRVTDMNNVIPNRPVHYDLEQMDIVGSLSETTVVWTMYDDSTIDNELYTSEIYTTEDTEHTVSVYAEDYLGLEGSGDRTVQTNTVNPVASIPDISPAVEENSLLYTLDSYDSDSTIKEYTWKLPKLDEEGSVIDGENVIYNERNPEHFWNYAGQYNVELTVEDRYGNTNTTTKSMQILGSPPKANADITRVTSNFRVNDRFDITNVVPNRPILYYPLDFSDGITQEYARSLDGTIDGSLSQVSGASEDTQALRFDGSSSIRVPNNANNKISEQVAISAWVKTREDGTIYSAIDGTNDNSITLRTSESNPDFEVVSNGEPIGLNFNTNIKNGEWNHIVASYDIVEGLKLYVNGELDNSNSRDVGTLNIDSKPTKIGADARGNAGAGNFIGDISNIQMYDMRLNEEDAVDIYNNNGNTLVDVSNQGVFYEFGEPYHDTSKSTSKSSGLGTVDNLEDHYNIISSSNVDNEDSEQYLEIENVDYSQYNTIYMTYDAEFYREITQGADITGIISIESEGQKSERIVYNDMNVRDNGVMSFDVSNIDTTESLYVSAKSFGSNRGYTNLEVYEIWGNTGSQTNYPSRTEFYDSVYPDISSNTDIHETRNGVRISQRDITAQKELGNIGEPGIQHNIIPVGNANSVNVQHNIRTQSANIYGDSSGSYTLGSGAVNPISIFCESSSLLRTPCSNTGNSPDELTLDSSSYSHVGLETGLLDGDTIIESFGVNSETSSTMYPTVHFDGSTSSGSGAGIYIKEYEWDLSTDTSFRADYVGETFTHKFNEIGTHSVALRTTDTFGETSTEVFNFNVSNLEPTIRAQFTTETDLGSEATFTAGAESPGEGEIQQIIWDMGDGNYLQGEDISYEYSTGGEYDVTVIAIDDAGLTTSETRTIRVAGSDPDLEGITTSARAHVLDTVLFDTSGNGFDSLNNEDHPRGVQSRIDLTAAEDPNGGELTFNWNFLSRSLFNVDNPHLIIADIGTSTFGVTAQNSERRTKSKEITIETYNNGPSLELDVDTPIDEVEDENLDGITFVSEPVDVTVNANHPHERIGGEITVDMGDGTTKTHTVPDDADSTYTYTFEHQYDINPDEYSRQDFPAEFVTQAQIEDDFGATAEDSKNIEVQHRGVEITDFASYNQDNVQTTDLEAGEPIDYEVTANAPDVPDGDLSYRFEFSDGETSGWQSSNTYQHQWTIVGQQTVEVQVREPNYGFADVDSLQVELRVRESCRRIQINNEDPESGLYYVVPEGFDAPVEVLCDMKYDGGGWTLVLAANSRDNGQGYKDGDGNWNTEEQYATANAEFGTLNQQSNGDAWKLSDDMIDQIQFDGEGVIRATTLEYNSRRFFKSATYEHGVNVVNRGDKVTTSYKSPNFNNDIDSHNPDSDWSLQGISDSHYPPTGQGYSTVHCHNPCFVDSDTAIWVK